MDVLTLEFKDAKHHVTRGVEVVATPKPHIVIDKLEKRSVDVDPKLYEGLAMGQGPCSRNGEFVVDHQIDGKDACPECEVLMDNPDRKTSTPKDEKVMGLTLYDHHYKHGQVAAKFRLRQARPVMMNHKPCLVPADKSEKGNRILVFVEADDGVEQFGVKVGLQIDVMTSDRKFKKFNATATAGSGFKKRAVVLGPKDYVTVSYKSDKGWEGAKLVVGSDMQIKLNKLPTKPFPKR